MLFQHQRLNVCLKLQFGAGTKAISVSADDIILNINQSMKWLSAIGRFFKQGKAATKLGRMAQASLAIAFVLFCRRLFASSSSPAQTKVIMENISSFYDKLKSRQIKTVSILANSINYTDVSSQIFSAQLPRHAQSTLASELRSNNINFNYLRSANSKWGAAILIGTLMGLSLFLLFNGSQSDVGTRQKPAKPVTFDDVIGLQECKQSLREIIEYMRDPQRFLSVGARMRKGIIFYGPSGTGKTTLAKATAGEAGVPFFSCNASEFCEVYVGVGPKRVKELFRKAKQAAPSIIYIDQIDAIGNRRQAGMFNQSANSEKNSTINQLLSEMDGFSSKENVLVIGSTNRLEMIDPSLLRAGRFDLKIRIPLPTEQDRLLILQHHLAPKKCTLSQAFLRGVVRPLEEWSGAELQNLANEAAYAALRAQSESITEEILSDTLRRLQDQVCR